MRKIPETHRFESLLYVVVYRDDIEIIIDTLREHHFTPTITYENYEYESLDELIKHRGIYLRTLDIKGKSDKNNSTFNNSISVSFSPGFSWQEYVHISFNEERGNEENSTKAAYLEIFDFLKKRRSWTRKLTNPMGWFFALPFEIYFLKKFFPIREESERAFSDIYLISFIIFLLIIPTIIFIYRKMSRPIRLTPKHTGGFWKHNISTIAITLVITIIGGIIVSSLDWIFLWLN